MTATPWATIAEIKSVTGVDVDEPTRSLAAASVELVTGLIEEVERTDITARDRYWLRQAVAFQAAWLVIQADYLERSDVSSASQDGQSAQGNPDWLVLSPLARKAIKRLSWRGVRTMVIPSGAVRAQRVSALISDDHPGWRADLG